MVYLSKSSMGRFVLKWKIRFAYNRPHCRATGSDGGSPITDINYCRSVLGAGYCRRRSYRQEQPKGGVTLENLGS